MPTEQELHQICRIYTIPCPACTTENSYHRLKRDMARAATMEGDGHPLEYKWQKPGFDSVDPLQFFMGVCTTCGFTGELDDADYRQAGKNPDVYRKDFAGPSLTLFKDGATAGKGGAQSLLKRVAQEDPLVKVIAHFHLGILTQCSRIELEVGRIARYYLRIAWCYRDHERFYPESDLEAIVASLKKCRKRFKEDLGSHVDYPEEPIVATNEVEALRLCRTYFERNYEVLREASIEDELRLRLLLAEIGFRLYQLSDDEDDYKKASTFFSGCIEQCVKIISDKSIVGGLVNRARGILDNAGERGRELRALREKRGSSAKKAKSGGNGAPAKKKAKSDGKGVPAKKKAAVKSKAAFSTERAGDKEKAKVEANGKGAEAEAPALSGERSVTERDKATRQIIVLNEKVESLRKRVEEVEADNQKWRQVIGKDSLTGLPNRIALFRIELPKVIRNFNESTPITCIAVGLDQVAAINLEHGWLMGDKMLQASAKGLRKFLKEEDNLYRVDGANFVITGQMDGNAARQRATEMRRALGGANVRVDQTMMPLASSLGVVTMEKKVSDSETEVAMALYTALIRTLYKAKEMGGNTAEIHNVTRF
ncbi:MAG: GGDEF domain-containing protein [Candidatus Latescibacterota bacterium]|nr:GGDEF domain-containing protein [Candidatus Latescibacterota bacterium]